MAKKRKQPKKPQVTKKSIAALNASFDRLEHLLSFRRKVRKHAHGS